MIPELEINVLPLKKAALVSRAVNHPLRQQMLYLIDAGKRMTVTELHTKLALEQSVASQHLAILRRTGYVRTTRQGKFVFYSVNYDRLKEVHQHTASLLG